MNLSTIDFGKAEREMLSGWKVFSGTVQTVWAQAKTTRTLVIAAASLIAGVGVAYQWIPAKWAPLALLAVFIVTSIARAYNKQEIILTLATALTAAGTDALQNKLSPTEVVTVIDLLKKA